MQQIQKMGKKYLLGLLIQLCYITILYWTRTINRNYLRFLKSHPLPRRIDR
jgi:hypothetical protein